MISAHQRKCFRTSTIFDPLINIHSSLSLHTGLVWSPKYQNFHPDEKSCFIKQASYVYNLSRKEFYCYLFCCAFVSWV
jgi:hypothetical protein